MPTRYLRPGIRDSELIDQLSPLAECLFYRLLVTVDDFGRADARPAMIKAQCFPVKASMTPDQCKTLLIELHRAHLVLLYRGPDDKPYLQMQKWTNVPRAAASHFPAPASKSAQMHTDADGASTTAPVTVTVTETDKGGEAPPPAPAPSPPQKAKNRKFKADDVELPTWLERGLWVRWCVDRRKRGKSITEEAAKLQIQALDGYRADGHTPTTVIEHSISGGFQGLYPPKVKPGTLVALTTPKAWHETADGLVARGKELGITWGHESEPWKRGDPAYPEWRAFKDKVTSADKLSKDKAA